MIIEYLNPPSIIVEGRSPKFQPIDGVPLLKRLVVSDIRFSIHPNSSGEGLGFYVDLIVEHYLSDDEEKKTIITTDGLNPKIESPYPRSIYVNAAATAFRSNDGSEVVKATTPEELDALVNSATTYINEFQWFVRLFKEGPVGAIASFIESLIIAEDAKGKTN